ncbi:hypothetical protein [Actinoplanes rectilineatus]|uniref:hypothetical protein n=1 Tax=Actinoplanes rectilineatus TaxID=113571 RepID=UPI000696DDA5|nr:hypothetical protein [Actinoplanes rectilineatus]
MSIRRTVAPAALLLAMLAAGCANNTSDSTDAGAPAPASSSAGIPESTTVQPSGSAPADAKTITGTVTAGVEPGCLLLKDATGDHLLVAKDQTLTASLTVGTQVTVVGVPEPGMMSTCMQGEPFRVLSVAAN